MHATLLLLLKLGFTNRHKSFSIISKHGSFKGNHETYFADIINFLTLKPLKKCLSKLSKLKKVLTMIWKRFLLAKLDEQALSKAKFLRHGGSPFMASNYEKKTPKVIFINEWLQLSQSCRDANSKITNILLTKIHQYFTEPFNA